ncbi:MAG TPA: histone deacetylase [Candidatus Hydrogenedentes bacterium]|nr:histone deacetylase [Candidatus Hydrogenedentota bacterium]
MARTAIYYSEKALAHDTGEFHPESSDRLRAALDAIRRSGLNTPIVEPEAASIEDICRIHTREHVDTVQRCCLGKETYPDPDTVFMEHTWDAALLAAGAGITAARAILDGACESAFVLMRPPGHHAEPDYAMGFCVFNNIAITARWIRDVAKAHRVAIFDFDVHHGNGTQHAFYNDDTVFFISLHEYPQFPGTGFPHERGKSNTNLNVQMPPGCSPDQWTNTVRGVVVPQLQLFAPDFLLISAGFDAHRLDPLGNQLLEAEHFAEMTRLVREIAGGRIIAFLEGGYHPVALGQSLVAHLRELAGL